MVVEVEAGHRVRGARLHRLLLELPRPAVPVELDDSIPLGIAYPIRKDGRTSRAGCRSPQHLGQAMSVKDVIAEREVRAVLADEVAPNDEGLRDAVRLFLNVIADPEPEVTAVTKEALEGSPIARCGDDEDFADARQHQGGERIVDHGLV